MREFSQSGNMRIELELLDVDANDPDSLRVRLSISISHSSGEYRYSADDIWFSMDVLMRFQSDLSKGLLSPANLFDQSEYISIYLSLTNNGKSKILNVKISAYEPVLGYGEIALKSDFSLDYDTLFVEELRRSVSESINNLQLSKCGK